MKELFRVWKRKGGMVILGVALACIVSCAMSYGHDDSQVFGNHWIGVFFDRGDLCWLTHTDDPLGRGSEFRLASPTP